MSLVFQLLIVALLALPGGITDSLTPATAVVCELFSECPQVILTKTNKSVTLQREDIPARHFALRREQQQSLDVSQDRRFVQIYIPTITMADSITNPEKGDANRQCNARHIFILNSNRERGEGSGRKFRVGSLNVNTLRGSGRVGEVVKTLSRRKVDICCVQETKYWGGDCKTIKGNDTNYKLFWSGNDNGTAGVGVFVAEEWVDKVFKVQRVSDRIMVVKIAFGRSVLTFLSVYAPLSWLSDAVKDQFYNQLRAVTAKIRANEFLILCGDLNGSVGSANTGYSEVHGGMGYGSPEPDADGQRILEYALAHDLLIGNTLYKKRDSHLITYTTGEAAAQTDYILFRKNMRRFISNVMVIPSEDIGLHHKLLVGDMKLNIPPRA